MNIGKPNDLHCLNDSHRTIFAHGRHRFQTDVSYTPNDTVLDHDVWHEFVASCDQSLSFERLTGTMFAKLRDTLSAKQLQLKLLRIIDADSDDNTSFTMSMSFKEKKEKAEKTEKPEKTENMMTTKKKRNRES